MTAVAPRARPRAFPGRGAARSAARRRAGIGPVLASAESFHAGSDSGARSPISAFTRVFDALWRCCAAPGKSAGGPRPCAGPALPSPPRGPILGRWRNPPTRPAAPLRRAKRGGAKRDPAKHSKKDPAKPTRAKASRPDSAPTDPALEELLNPGIRQGTAGIGSQTGQPRGAGGASGLQPPPDNSWDRRADFSGAHTARRSTRAKEGFGEAPQSGYVGKTPVAPGELDPDLAKSLGLEATTIGAAVGRNARRAGAAARQVRREPRRGRDRAGAGEPAARGAARSSARSPGCRTGRRGRTSPRAAAPLVIKSDFEPKGDQPQAIAQLVEGVKRHDRNQVLLGVTGSGKTFTMAKVIEAHPAPGPDPGAQQDAGGPALRRVQELLSRTTRSSISSATTTTTSPKPTCRAPTPISRRNPRSTSRSTACATRPRARCSSATT